MTQSYTSLADFAGWEIEAYLDGEPIDHLAAFLAQNPAAQAELAQQQARAAQLQSALYRFDCPDPAEMQGYHLQEISAAQRQQVETHLHTCPHCRVELAALQAFADEPLPVEQNGGSLAPEQPSLLEQLQEWIEDVRVVVATLVTPGGPQLAGAALRSEPTPSPSAAAATEMLLFEAADADVSLVVNRRPDGTFRLNGQIFASSPIATAQYVLTSADITARPVTGTISHTGTFVTERLAAGIYQLVLKLPDQAVVIPNVSLND